MILKGRRANKNVSPRNASQGEDTLEPLKERVAKLEAERAELIRERAELEERIALGKSGAARLHGSYLKRLENQTKSTLALSDTVNSVLGAIKEISQSYKEMLKAVHALGNITRELGDSFRQQTETQEDINRRADTANAASENEVSKAKALKSDLGQLESIRAFMANAMDTIEDVSSRLSLLSMNGRIEAAHAGAAGRGFAVVAQEMLNLQQENGKVIASQRAQLGGFLPLMSAMQNESDAVEAQAREQESIIRDIAEKSVDLKERTKANQDRIDDLISSVEELAASIEQGQKTVQNIEEETGKVESIFKEEVFVSGKVNSLDQFLFDVAERAPSLAEAGHSLVNEYQKLSVINGKSYVWQADSWIITDSKKLPPAVGPFSGLGDRVLVCVGQTVDNPTFPKPLAEGSGILAVLPVDAIADPSSPLQGFMPLLDRLGLKLADLKNPRGIDLVRTHGNMAVIEHFEGTYRTTMREKIQRGNLVSSFCFGGAFPNGDVMINGFLSDFQRHTSDAVKFGMIGESMVLAFQSLAEMGRYWKL